MKKPALLVLAAAAGALPLGLLAANFGMATPHAAAQTPSASQAPPLLASPKEAEVVDAADAFLATLSDEQRAIAQIELKPSLAIRWSNLPGGSDPQRRLLSRSQARAGRGGPEGRPGGPRRGGLLAIPGVRAADDAFAKGRGGPGPGGRGSPGPEEGRGRSGPEEGRRSCSEEGRRPGRRLQLRGGAIHDRDPGQAVEDQALDPATGRPPSRNQHLL